MHWSKYSVIGYKLSDHMSWSGTEGKQKSENIYACAKKNTPQYTVYKRGALTHKQTCKLLPLSGEYNQLTQRQVFKQ